MDDSNNLKQIYKDLTYFDYYGSSTIFLILITIVFCIISCYCFVVANIQTIKNDWPNQRCNPRVMPFAGLINKPDDMTYSEFTSQNFAYCSQNIISSGVGNAVQPLTFVISSLVTLADQLKTSLDSIRDMVDNVRTNIQSISEEIMGRLINITIPLQQIIIVFRDIIGKVQGTLTATLMTLLGSYYALRSLMGAIAELIIRFLIGLVIMIAVCWLSPVGWGIAPVLTGVFVGISIYMTVILVFMSIVLKVEPSLQIPKLVKCFDADTSITMNDGSTKKICQVCVGDVLENDNAVTATFKLDATDTVMYDLNGVTVSSTHYVKFGGEWMPVSQHPDARKILTYEQPHLYCLNTSLKIIAIKGMIFCDWDEVYEEELKELKNNGLVHLHDCTDIHRFMDGGFVGGTKIKLKDGTLKNIQFLEPRDILINGEFVYGVVEINGKTVNGQYKHQLGDAIFEGGPNLTMCDKHVQISSTLELKSKERETTDDKLYHILTDAKTFECNGVQFRDYNATIETFYWSRLLTPIFDTRK